jgi:hypothetical protein
LKFRKKNAPAAEDEFGNKIRRAPRRFTQRHAETERFRPKVSIDGAVEDVEHFFAGVRVHRLFVPRGIVLHQFGRQFLDKSMAADATSFRFPVDKCNLYGY